MPAACHLYIFFETGVAEAYSSVIALTTKQWWLGGIMRSVHRYASDTMVLTMMLHMLRYFAFNLYHGYRWVLVGHRGDADLDGLNASGINGYMLPWDQLAQYITVTKLRMAGLAAHLQRQPDAQLPVFRPCGCALLHAAVPSCTWAFRWCC